ncbi:MAG: hypothetical protein OEV45_15845 [Desulfobacteraceae bacterium]|nr:hypothetical protein [Desulfobacteraceae bacterium]
MAATTIRVAYALFFFSFSMWIVILLSVCFQNGRWANPIQFPSYTFLGMFIGSAIASSVACMIIGFEYLGLGSEFTRRARTFGKTRSANVRLRKASIGGSKSLSGDYYVLRNFEDELEDLNLLVLINKKKHEKLRVSVRNEPCQPDETLIVINSSDTDPAQRHS